MKPILSRYSVNPEALRYSVTTPDPGDKLVLINEFILIPFSTAFLATRPAAIKESGLEVFVQDVMAAKTTEPFLSVCYSPFTLNLVSAFNLFSGIPKPLKPTLFGKHFKKSSFTSFSGTRSWGLLGPEIHGSTVVKSS